MSSEQEAEKVNIELREILNSLILGNIRTVRDAELAIKKAGYRKVPELKVLSDEDYEVVNKVTDEDVIGMVMDAQAGRITSIQLAELIVQRCKATAQAQRDYNQRQIEAS